jgi:hypothetical protein
VKTRTLKDYALALAIIVSCALSSSKANAQLRMTLSGTAGSPIITATFSGSSTIVSQSMYGYVGGMGWEFIPSAFNPFPPAITGADYGVFQFISGSASISINGATQSMAGVFLQDSSNSPVPGAERFGTTGFSYGPQVGEVFEWAGTAAFDVSGKGLTFSDFNGGDSGPISSTIVGGIAGELVIVPEPSTFSISLASLGVVLLVRGRLYR